MQQGWFGVPYLVWALVCFALALIWGFVWPADRAVDATGLRFWLIRWGHTLVWSLLGVMCLLRSSTNATLNAIAEPFGLAALLSYLAFMAASFVLK